MQNSAFFVRGETSPANLNHFNVNRSLTYLLEYMKEALVKFYDREREPD